MHNRKEVTEIRITFSIQSGELLNTEVGDLADLANEAATGNCFPNCEVTAEVTGSELILNINLEALGMSATHSQLNDIITETCERVDRLLPGKLAVSGYKVSVRNTPLI